MTDVKTDQPARRRGRPDEGARDAVIEAARQLFIEHDYADVSTDQIISRAGVSRGALYHHFPGKVDVFRAVFVEGERKVVQRLAAEAQADSPFESLRAGSRAYMREAETNVELRRIGLAQSRAVLGWEGWREVAAKLGLGLVEGGVRAAMEAGEMRPGDPATVAHVILGALIEAAMIVATADDPAAARARVEPTVDALLDGFRAPADAAQK
jgi:AcrR family transcriptional regulator